jgi:hypothetical protein
MDMPDHVAETALAEQNSHTDDDPQSGMVLVYLETKLPSTWDSYTIDQRVQWYKATDQYREEIGRTLDSDGNPIGLLERESVCAQEIWSECFQKRLSDMSFIDSKKICESLRKLPGWKQEERTRRVGPYGPQRCFVKHKGEKP